MRHEAHFTILANQAIRDGRLSGLARSVLMELLSRPPGWQTNADQMWQQARKDRGDRAEGRRAFRQAFAELEEFGYLIRERERHGSRFETVLHLFHLPQERADDEATEGDESDPVGGTGFGTSETGTSESGTSETGTSIRRTDQGSTDVGSTDQENSSSSAPVIPEPEPAPVVEKKTKKTTPEQIIIDKLSSAEARPQGGPPTPEEAAAIKRQVISQAAADGVRVHSPAGYLSGRDVVLLEQDLAAVRGLQKPVSASTGGFTWEDQLRGERRTRGGYTPYKNPEDQSVYDEALM
ncbi:hypothetical protein [Nocardiopsis dassonvillei]|uniref:hypothetical protein n=1 Tax=Nocardiopsis dassonvillei TaxID=2014 RepID=UPI00157CD7AA|nr:hypothetical protein [Nocardiopsis dassonvillei]